MQARLVALDETDEAQMEGAAAQVAEEALAAGVAALAEAELAVVGKFACFRSKFTTFVNFKTLLTPKN